MSQQTLELDVRPILRQGGEPFELIMRTLSSLAPSQGLRLLATFEPVPLFSVLARKGYTHRSRQLGEDDWEVVFTPGAAGKAEDAPLVSASNSDGWPAPKTRLDVRDLDPPEPMVRILAAVAAMQPSDVLAATLDREPVFLFPELKKRGHQWQGGFEADGSTYALQVRVGTGAGGAA